MEAVIVKRRIMEYLHQHSGFEPGRKYLGMSRISECPARLYRECLNGRSHEFSESTDRRSYRGYLFERDAIERLAQGGVVRPASSKELIADFDPRFRGHTDAEMLDGDLLEIKSVRSETFDEIQNTRKALQSNLDQVQLYLKYGVYRHGVILYICTETFRHYTVDVYPNKSHQERLIVKAKELLAAIDAGSPPACTCGRCFGFHDNPKEEHDAEPS